jgi:ABC-type sugar transport system substrate-binding protein
VRIVALAVILAMCGARADAQPAKIPRIGILIAASASFYSARVEAFRQRLGELGYVEGKNLSLSTDIQKGNSNGCLTLQPNWSVSKLTSLSPPARVF